MIFPNGETVTVVRAQRKDKFGDPVGPPPSEHTVGPCAVGPPSSADVDTSNRQAVQVDLEAFLPPGSDVLGTDNVRVRGLLYRVVGVPWEHRDPFSGWSPGMSVRLARNTG